MKIEHFEKLDCWNSARQLVAMVYTTIKKEELQKEFELKNQFLRAGISTINNIAEGFGRYHNKEFIRFLNIAIASGHELSSMTYVMLDQNFISQEEQVQLLECIVKTQKLTGGLIRYLVKSDRPSEQSKS